MKPGIILIPVSMFTTAVSAFITETEKPLYINKNDETTPICQTKTNQLPVSYSDLTSSKEEEGSESSSSIPESSPPSNISDPYDPCCCDHILGPRIKEDAEPVVVEGAAVVVADGDKDDGSLDSDEGRGGTSHPPLPDNLQYSIEFDLPIGFRRLRKAMLSDVSPFWKDAILKDALGYTEIVSTPWNHQNNPNTNSPIKTTITTQYPSIGSTKTTSYTLPASLLVESNRATERTILTACNHHHFVVKRVTSTPDVRFGGRFLAHTQIVVVNVGRDRVRMVCSVEAEFPNGEPLGFGGTIRYGMKKGAMDAFVKTRDAVLALCSG